MRISDWSSDVCSSDLPWPAFDRRQQLPEGYGCPACVLVVRQCAIDTRGSCFLIPGHEMRKIDAARLFHAGEKVVDRRHFAVVTVEIEVARFAKADRAEKDGKNPQTGRAEGRERGGQNVERSEV